MGGSNDDNNKPSESIIRNLSGMSLQRSDLLFLAASMHATFTRTINKRLFFC